MNNPSLRTNLRFVADPHNGAGSYNVHTDLTDRPNDPQNDFETFSFAVAHGLRASLRSINGFAKMLTEDKSSELDEEGRDYVKIIRENALRMNRLVDDVMLLSRYYTVSLDRQAVNLNKMINRLVAGINFKGEVNIDPMEPVNADPEMMQQLWFALLSNAVKFSSKTDHPLIEAGSVQKGNETVYYVRDNGVGFDMKYAGRLFMAFQRMHNEGEFPGAGIGLAIAHKIVTRHGGQIWAEAQPGKGATFYFTLNTL